VNVKFMSRIVEENQSVTFGDQQNRGPPKVGGNSSKSKKKWNASAACVDLLSTFAAGYVRLNNQDKGWLRKELFSLIGQGNLVFTQSSVAKDQKPKEDISLKSKKSSKKESAPPKTKGPTSAQLELAFKEGEGKQLWEKYVALVEDNKQHIGDSGLLEAKKAAKLRYNEAMHSFRALRKASWEFSQRARDGNPSPKKDDGSRSEESKEDRKFDPILDPSELERIHPGSRTPPPEVKKTYPGGEENYKGLAGISRDFWDKLARPHQEWFEKNHPLYPAVFPKLKGRAGQSE